MAEELLDFVDNSIFLQKQPGKQSKKWWQLRAGRVILAASLVLFHLLAR